MSMRLAMMFVALALVPAARADRYRITVGLMPPSYVSDAQTFSTQLGGKDPVFEAAPEGSIPTPPSAPAPAPIPLAENRDQGADAIPPAPPATQLLVAADSDTAHIPENPGPAPDFLGELQTFYFISTPAEVNAIWKWYVKEPAELGYKERTANAVMRQILANNGPLVPSSTARMDLLKPGATRGTVRSSNGLQLRATPWGPINGALQGGDVVELVPPAQGPWYFIAGRGWVSGLWMDLR